MYRKSVHFMGLVVVLALLLIGVGSVSAAGPLPPTDQSRGPLPPDLARELQVWNPDIAGRPDLVKLVAYYYKSGILSKEQILQLPLPGQVVEGDGGKSAPTPDGWWANQVSAYSWRFDWNQFRPHYIVMYPGSYCTNATWNGSSNYYIEGEGWMWEWGWVDNHTGLMVPTRFWSSTMYYPLNLWRANCYFN